MAEQSQQTTKHDRAIATLSIGLPGAHSLSIQRARALRWWAELSVDEGEGILAHGQSRIDGDKRDPRRIMFDAPTNTPIRVYAYTIDKDRNLSPIVAYSLFIDSHSLVTTLSRIDAAECELNALPPTEGRAEYSSVHKPDGFVQPGAGERFQPLTALARVPAPIDDGSFPTAAEVAPYSGSHNEPDGDEPGGEGPDDLNAKKAEDMATGEGMTAGANAG